jgi:hypothetical protein
MTNKYRARNHYIETLYQQAELKIVAADDYVKGIGDTTRYHKSPSSLRAQFAMPNTAGLNSMLQLSLLNENLRIYCGNQVWPGVIRIWQEETCIAPTIQPTDSEVHVNQYEVLADKDRGLYHAAVISHLSPRPYTFAVPSSLNNSDVGVYVEKHKPLRIAEIEALTELMSSFVFCPAVTAMPAIATSR